MVVALADHTQAQLAVIEQQRGADLGGGDDFRVRQTHAAGVAGGGVHVEHEVLPGLQLHAAGLELADPQFRPLHVGENADRAAEFFFDRADHLDARGMVLMRTMGEIQTEYIRPGLEQLPHHFRGGAGRPQRGDDLRAAMTAETFTHFRYSFLN